MMEDALAPFTDVVSRVRLQAPAIPYISNVTGTWITPEQATSPAYYATHLRAAVRFSDGIRTLTGERPDVLLEVGPGTTMAVLARMTLDRAARARAITSLPHPNDARSETESMLDAAGRLWVSGAVIDWESMHADDVLHRIPLPTYPFERRQYRVRGNRAASPSSGVDRAGSAPLDNAAARPALTTGFEPPNTDTERRIADIWTELLGISDIGRHDGFFELGGDSLQATRVAARLRAVFGGDIEADRVFALQTIAQLAQLIDAGVREQRERVSF
jgi:acyl transferase domain-containing protein